MVVEDVVIMSLFEDNMKDTGITHMRQRWPSDLSKENMRERKRKQS